LPEAWAGSLRQFYPGLREEVPRRATRIVALQPASFYNRQMIMISCISIAFPQFTRTSSMCAMAD